MITKKKKKYFRIVENRRTKLGVEYCSNCGKKLKFGCQHHYLCNECWNELNFFKKTAIPFKKNLKTNDYKYMHSRRFKGNKYAN